MKMFLQIGLYLFILTLFCKTNTQDAPNMPKSKDINNITRGSAVKNYGKPILTSKLRRLGQRLDLLEERQRDEIGSRKSNSEHIFEKMSEIEQVLNATLTTVMERDDYESVGQERSCKCNDTIHRYLEVQRSTNLENTLLKREVKEIKDMVFQQQQVLDKLLLSANQSHENNNGHKDNHKNPLEGFTTTLPGFTNKGNDQRQEVSTMPLDKCSLEATMPDKGVNGGLKGRYYGAYVMSRIQYDDLNLSSFRLRSKFSMYFRTQQPNGVLFYTADAMHIDHMAVSINNGHIRYTFNGGSGIGTIVASLTYNDGQWHKLGIGYTEREGSLTIDDKLIGTTTPSGYARSIDVQPPFFFGGLNERYILEADKNLDGITTSFRGCIANITMNDRDLWRPTAQIETQECSDQIDAGAFFYGEGGYIRRSNSMDVSQDLTVEIQLRPRGLDGVIFYEHGKNTGEYLILQMVDGQLWFTAGSLYGEITVKYIPEMNNELCDGLWHSITTKKTSALTILTVDKYKPISSFGTPLFDNTYNDVYLGGTPDNVTKGLYAKGPYQGCMRNFFINGEYQYLGYGFNFSNVTLGPCPVN